MTNTLKPLTDDEAALLYHVTTYGAPGYPVEKIGRRWQWRSWRGVLGSPIVYRTKREAIAAFECWIALSLAKFRDMRAADPSIGFHAQGLYRSVS
jgi:hypothetical protein